MEIKEFAKKIQNKVVEVLGDEYEVKLQEVQKNNGVLLQGLIILKKEQNISPTIYLQPFWEAYENGVTMAEVVRRIIQIYREDTPKQSIDMSFFKDFAKVKDRICYRLINAEQNSSLLQRIPHIPFLDLAICFYYAYEGDMLGKGSILIYNTHLELWQTSITEMMQLAQINTPRIFPWEFNSMEVVIRGLMEEKDGEMREQVQEGKQEDLFADLPMYIVSNSQKIHGAASILYPDLLALLADKIKADFYILPSSIHEVILLEDNGDEDPERLREMIAEVNRTQVEPEEVLSDSLYYFSRINKKIEIL